MTMTDIMQAARRVCEGVLGCVVDVRGSAYRQPGARVWIQRSGERLGMISGGCLDKDLSRHAHALTESGPRTVLYDTRGDEFHPHGKYGSGCDGIVEILLERVATSGGALLDALALAWSRDEPLCVATLYQTPPSYAEHIGARIGSHGLASQTLPASITDRLAQVVVEAPMWRRPRSISIETASGQWMALAEAIAPPLDLVVFGAGDDAQPLVALAATLGWSVRVIDKWPALARPERFPRAAAVQCVEVADVKDVVAIGPRTYCVVMTHNFKDDRTLLPVLLQSPAPWIGLMGPRRRTVKLLRQLLERGALPGVEAFGRVQTPVGVDLGADAPEEVALSIVSGVLAAKNGAQAGLLRDREASIHNAHQRVTLDLVQEIEG